VKRLAILLLAACGGSSRPPPSTAPVDKTPPPVAKTIDCNKLLDKVAPVFMKGETLSPEERARAITSCQEDVAKNPSDPVMLCMMDAVGKEALTACLKLVPRSTKTEAELMLDNIGKSSKVMFLTNAEFAKGSTKQLPDAPCCLGPNNRCPVTDQRAKDPVWAMLEFQIDEPNRFQYSYISDGKAFHAEAVGDLDCDGIMITYKLDGDAPDGNPRFRITPPPSSH
jgi:hypothetical protein